ncbi:PAAR domain-containing protein [Burkholderia cenocepacia]|uniref:PAAR domain-containing protein n=1 Tax=Burkholderia cenocepacia TaxID=95486 RepID=UPI001F197DA5|nr:PAAR domain-containing protein [Burkholderia cenocepacia]MCF1368079.1 PAAR domain-containing protein [Burkholderia cenocepacia]MCF1385612.1 PAAR domain-containing protein [Burkholderia cenocepacia]MEC4774412.1 PAAR domain-containing protein [Burkholderia cenocepacia]
MVIVSLRPRRTRSALPFAMATRSRDYLIRHIRQYRQMRFVREGTVRKAAIRHGDPITTSGIVFAYSSTIYDDGKHVALSGDEATCGNCDGTFKIFGTGAGMSEKGRNVVVDGDLVLCPCKANRVLAGSNPGIFLTTYSNEELSVANVVAPNVARTSADSEEEVEHFFEIVDAVSGRPVDGMNYKVQSNGRTLIDNAPLAHGRTRSFSMQAHPDLAVVVWRTGAVR